MSAALARVNPAGALTVARPGILQRQCACQRSGHPCERCARKSALQQKAGGGGGTEPAPPIDREVHRSESRSFDPASRALMEPGFGHDFARMEMDCPRELEEEANRVAARVVANAGEPLRVPVRAVAPRTVQKQERPETPPSITTLPGEAPADPEAEEEKKIAAMWENLGTELAKEALKQFGKIPGVAEVYQAIEGLFELPAVQVVGGIGYTAGAATAIMVNAIDMQSRTEPGAVPPQETMFGVKGTWDFTSPPKDIKVMTPIGDLPPSFGEEKPSSGGSTTPAGKPPSATPEDPIGKNLREAQEEQFVMNWVLSRQDEILNPVKESRRKPAGQKKKGKKRKAPRKPAASERRSREEEWPSFKRRPEGAALAHDELEMADAGRRTPGRPLDSAIRDRMERSLGCDFGRVRLHADAASAAAAAALNARAYTVGPDVVFGAGEFRPATPEGLGLLAHELTHVVQQGGARPARESSDDALRREPPASRTGPTPAAPRTGTSAVVGGHRFEPAPTVPLLQPKCACGDTPRPGGECEACRRKRLALQACAGRGPEPGRVPPAAHKILRSPGRPLDGATRAFMEPRFGHDFSRVRIHAGGQAAESARVLDAQAYTLGADIVFGQGAYEPSTLRGRYVLAHELAHVMQRDHHGRTATGADAFEREAAAAALRVAAGRSVRVFEAAPAGPLTLSRFDWTVLGAGIGGATGTLLAGAAVGIARAAGAALGPLGALGILGAGLAAGALAGGLIAYGSSSDTEGKDEAAASLEDPEFRRGWEEKLREGVRVLEQKREQEGGCRFPPTLDPSGEPHDLRFDDENWVSTIHVLSPEGKPRPIGLGAVAFRPRSAAPYEAVDLLFKHLDRWECDCRLFPEMALLYAWRHALEGKAEVFNARFANLQLSAEGTVGLKRESLDPEDAASWDGAPVGTKVAWVNHSPKARAPFEFEHAIKVHRGGPGDPDRYVAHPFPGEHTEAEIKDLLAREASDYPWLQEVTEEALKKLEGEDVPPDVRQSLESIKGQAVSGLPAFLELGPIKTLRLEAAQRRREPADVQKWINLILKNTRREPRPEDRRRYLDENIERRVLQVPK